MTTKNKSFYSGNENADSREFNKVEQNSGIVEHQNVTTDITQGFYRENQGDQSSVSLGGGGTLVEANPTDSSSVELARVRIGDTVYAITHFDKSYNSLTGRPSLALVATSGRYSDLSGAPNIPTVPTVVSAFTNDLGYITDISGKVNIESGKSLIEDSPTVDGDYNYHVENGVGTWEEAASGGGSRVLESYLRIDGDTIDRYTYGTDENVDIIAKEAEGHVFIFRQSNEQTSFSTDRNDWILGEA